MSCHFSLEDFFLFLMYKIFVREKITKITLVIGAPGTGKTYKIN